ncbi:hypothetical protein MLD38_007312 [Melastoma candidum]|uniref:Uncharacterized protein n=1 Tax=Melastoma candidum TaxID=119954 RepID=A0ACB9RZ93_9MYRT|nr:hypothetical protein MLD38_007312 [Melastoma candidum]
MAQLSSAANGATARSNGAPVQIKAPATNQLKEELKGKGSHDQLCDTMHEQFQATLDNDPSSTIGTTISSWTSTATRPN